MPWILFLFAVVTAGPTTRPFDKPLVLDARTIYGLAHFDFAAPAQDDAGQGILGVVHADWQCNTIDSDTLYVIPGTYQGALLPGAQPGKIHLSVVGSLEAAAVLHGSMVKRGQNIPYAWAEPPWPNAQLSGPVRLPTLAIATAVFRTGGAQVLAKVNLDVTGPQRLTPFVALPSDAGRFIAPALKVLANDPPAFAAHAAPTDVGKLKLLLAAENPIVACQAAQVLARSGYGSILPAAAGSADDFRAAVFLSLALNSAADGDGAATTQSIIDMARTSDPAKLKMIAQGAWSVWARPMMIPGAPSSNR